MLKTCGAIKMSYYPKVLYQLPKSAGKPFRPSNGTEGMIFMDAFCMRCIHEKFSHTLDHADKKCDILSKSMLHELGDVEYPKEWIYNEEGWPVCTAWKHWDWGGDDWDNGNINEPPPEPVNDPNQLMFPFMIDEIIETETIEELVEV